MKTTKGITMSTNQITVASSPTKDFLTEYDRQEAHAQATPCGVTGCDGRMHEGGLDPALWIHRVADLKFDNGAARVGMWKDGAGFLAEIELEGRGPMTAAELRAEAEVYEAYPAFLRAAADKLDALNQ